MNELAKNSHMEKHDLLNAQGVSLLSGAKILDAPLSLDELNTLTSTGSIQVNRSYLPPPFPLLSTTNKEGVFLYSRFGPPRGRPPVGPIVTLVALVACVLISIGLALFYQFSKYHARAAEAFEVLSLLREGKLSARMPIKRFDELSL